MTRRDTLSEAIGALRSARRTVLQAIDDIGDAAQRAADIEKLQDDLTDLEHALDGIIARARGLREGL